MTDPLRSILSPLYHPLVGEFFDRPRVIERRATCGSCAMCDHGEASPVAMTYFNPDTKCCTYTPNLANFLVGAALADPSPEMEEGKRRLRETIAKRIGVTPMYLMRPRTVTAIMQTPNDGFGRSRSLLCPYYDGSNPDGNCTIWRHREAVCRTWHCKFEGGQRGFVFWSGLKDYLAWTERALADAATKAIRPQATQPKLKQLTVEEVDGVAPNAADYEGWWGSWVGREEEFYVKCFEWVSRVTREEYAAKIDGGEAKEALEKLIQGYERLERRSLPAQLVRNIRMKERHAGDKVVVTTYSPYDAFALDKDLYEVIGLLRAADSLEDNLARLRDEHGVELAPELIEYLYVQGVLVDPLEAKAAKTDARAGGELEGRRTALGVILRARGVKLDAGARAQITAADGPTLDAWLRKAATATKPADVFGAAASGAKPTPKRRA